MNLRRTLHVLPIFALLLSLLAGSLIVPPTRTLAQDATSVAPRGDNGAVPSGLTAEIVISGARFLFDRIVPVQAADLTQVGQAGSQTIYARAGSAPFDRVYVALPSGGDGALARYLPEQNGDATTPCPAEAAQLASIDAGDLGAFAFAGYETDVATAGLQAAGTTADGANVYIGSEQPTEELFVEATDGLQRYVHLDAQGIPAILSNDFAFGGRTFAFADASQPAADAAKVGCAGPFPVQAAAAQAQTLDEIFVQVAGQYLRFTATGDSTATDVGSSATGATPDAGAAPQPTETATAGEPTVAAAGADTTSTEVSAEPTTEPSTPPADTGAEGTPPAATDEAGAGSAIGATAASGFPKELSVSGASYLFDRLVPNRTDGLNQVDQQSGLTIFASASSDVLYATDPALSDQAARYFPEGSAATTACPAEAAAYDVVDTGATGVFAFAGLETDLTTADLQQVGTTPNNQAIYAGTEQPIAEIFVAGNEGLLRFVLIDAQGLPASIGTDLAFAGQTFTFAGEATGVDQASLARAGCADAFPAFAQPGETAGAFSTLYVRVGTRLLSFSATGATTPVVPEASPTEAATETATTAPTETATETATTAPTETATTAPTETPTETATTAPTETATTAPTETATETATAALIDTPTTAPTETATTAPTETATTAPTETVAADTTAAPVVAPTESAAPAESPTTAATAAPTQEAETPAASATPGAATASATATVATAAIAVADLVGPPVVATVTPPPALPARIDVQNTTYVFQQVDVTVNVQTLIQVDVITVQNQSLTVYATQQVQGVAPTLFVVAQGYQAVGQYLPAAVTAPPPPTNLPPTVQVEGSTFVFNAISANVDVTTLVKVNVIQIQNTSVTVYAEQATQTGQSGPARLFGVSSDGTVIGQYVNVTVVQQAKVSIVTQPFQAAVVATLPPTGQPPAAATVAAPVNTCAGTIGDLDANGLPSRLPRQIQLRGVSYSFIRIEQSSAVGKLTRIGCVGAFEAASAENVDAAKVLYLRVPGAAGSGNVFRFESISTVTVTLQVSGQPRTISLKAADNSTAASYTVRTSWGRLLYSSVTVILYVEDVKAANPAIIYAYDVSSDVIGQYEPAGEIQNASDAVQAAAKTAGINPDLTIAGGTRYILTAVWTPSGSTANGWVTFYAPTGTAQGQAQTLLGRDPRQPDLQIYGRDS